MYEQEWTEGPDQDPEPDPAPQADYHRRIEEAMAAAGIYSPEPERETENGWPDDEDDNEGGADWRGRLLRIAAAAIIMLIAIAAVSWFYQGQEEESEAATGELNLETELEPAPGPGEELAEMKNGLWLRNQHRTSYRVIESFPWVQDGIEPDEAATLAGLLQLGVNDHRALEITLERKWLEDGLSPAEARAVENLTEIAFRDGPASASVAGMEFLESVSEADSLLIMGMNGLSRRGHLSHLLAHRTAADGITDDETLYALAATTISNPQLFGLTLDPGNASVSTVQTSTARTEHLKVSIVRTGTSTDADPTEAVLEAVAYVEEAMDMPLPTSHVTVLLDGHGVVPGYSGTNHGQAVAYHHDPTHPDAYRVTAFRLAMVHEVAHYFWTGNTDWIDEGVAETVEARFARDQGLRPKDTSNVKCEVRTIRDLDRLDPGPENTDFGCNYLLGHELFGELEAVYGPAGFQAALGKLHRLSRGHTEVNEGAAIEEVRETFALALQTVEEHWGGPQRDPEQLPTLAPPGGQGNSTRTKATGPITARNPTGGTAAPARPTTPAKTPVPTREPTPTVRPQRTAEAPTPAATATPYPVPTTAPPRAPTSTQEAIPTATPRRPTSATPPVPTATPHPATKPFRNEPAGFTVEVPYRWSASQVQGGLSAADPDNSSNRIQVSTESVRSGWSLGEFADAYRSRKLREAATWHEYLESSAEGRYRGAVNYVEIRYVRRVTAASCTEDVVTHLYRSREFPARLDGYAVTLSLCQGEAGSKLQAGLISLQSFQEL